MTFIFHKNPYICTFRKKIKSSQSLPRPIAKVTINQHHTAEHQHALQQFDITCITQLMLTY